MVVADEVAHQNVDDVIVQGNHATPACYTDSKYSIE
jgi:hypothetical protein